MDTIERRNGMGTHTWLYLHTLDGCPAYFDGEQLVYAENFRHWRDDAHVCVLRASLRQIEKDQQAHAAFRKKKGWDIGEPGYVIVGRTKGVIKWEGD